MNGQNGSADNLIVDRDKKLFHELKEKILLKEPALYIGMAKIGRYYLFSAAKKYLQNCPVSGYEIIIQDQFSLDELEDTTTMLKQLQKPVILCVNLSVAEDISEFINILFRLRKERGESFLFYIFGTVKNVCTALSHPSKEIFHYLSPLQLLDYEDTQKVVDEHLEKVGKVLPESLRLAIFEWSKGHSGLVKAITLLLIKNSDFTFGKESLLSEPSIIFMLTQILQDLPSQKISAALTDKLSGEDKSLLDKFKFIKDGKLFHPLLYALPVPHQEKFNKLSFFEEKIYLLLTRKKGEVVDREDIAKVVWGEIDWEERYSDWAISQVMHRLREKLKKIETAIVIKTVKGKGYLLRKN